MHTQCPECKAQRPISVKELRTSGGMITCNECSLLFDALELLNEEPVNNEKKYKTSLAIEKETKIYAPHWGSACTLCLIIFIFQIVIFEGYNLTQNSTLRPWLEKVCLPFKCQLPHYKSPGEFTILHGAFELNENGHYIFKASFTNQSAFDQNHPSIKLTLLDFVGQPFAKRVFQPKEYSKQALSLIPANTSAEIAMHIATPSKKIGGYRFEFI